MPLSRTADVRTPRGRRVVVAAVVATVSLALATLSGAWTQALAADGVGAVYASDVVPSVPATSDTSAVELGMRFIPTSDTRVLGIRFYRSAENSGPHTGSLWAPDGTRLSRVQFPDAGTDGWLTAALPVPVDVQAGQTYVVSYGAPHGRYAAAQAAFDAPTTRDRVTVPTGGGVYTYALDELPTKSYRSSSYYVDVVLAEERPAQPTGDEASVPPPQPLPTPASDALSLPRVPWEGGSAYWARFGKAKAAGWDDPGFFPIVATFAGVSSDEEVQSDKRLGINTYAGMWEGTPYRLLEDNGMFWIGGQLNSTFGQSSRNWVGHFLDDEVDGRFTPQAGRTHLQQIVDALPDDGRFRYANFTQMVLATDLPARDAEAFVNNYTDVVSTDMYWYTIPYCDWRPYRDVYLTPVGQANCRTASSYGKMMNSLRVRDAADGQLQPLWQFVELVNGGPGEGPFVANVSPGQLQGAVMSSIINEARGIVYFNQSMSGPCLSGNLVRQAQILPDYCGDPQVEAMKTINERIRALAPVINTQSYQHSFGPGLDTMLKSTASSVYVFAMIDGSSSPGERHLTLPSEVAGRTVTVLDEGRTLRADDAGRFTDTFADEYSFHIYKIDR